MVSTEAVETKGAPLSIPVEAASLNRSLRLTWALLGADVLIVFRGKIQHRITSALRFVQYG